jgi:hypothetical protein
MSISSLYFNGSFNNELDSKYLTVYSNCIALEEDAFINEISNTFSVIEIKQIQEVIEFGKNFKYGTRVVDAYYFSHALRIARFVYYNILSEGLAATLPDACGRSGFCAALAAALIHNCFEKNLMSRVEFAQKFGDYYCEAVDYITVDRDAMKSRQGVEEHYLKLSRAPKWVLGMRALDKADNLLILHVNPDQLVRLDYLKEIENDLLPVINDKQPNLSRLLLEECKWAAGKKHEIPDEDQLQKMEWSYKPFH